MASLHLDGIAVEWYYALEHDVGPVPWQRLPPPPPLCHYKLVELMDL
jgi:hypothetical protein